MIVKMELCSAHLYVWCIVLWSCDMHVMVLQ